MVTSAPIIRHAEWMAIVEIKIDRQGRQRREIEIDDLLPSIRERGIIQALVVTKDQDGQVWLVAGERRITAAERLGHQAVPIVWLEALDPITRKIIELEENVKRRDLTWQESARATREIHQLYCRRDPEWTLGETAAALGLALSYASNLMVVANDLADENVSKCGTLREAHNLLMRRRQRQAGVELEELLGPTAPQPQPPQPQPELPLGLWTPPEYAAQLQPTIQIGSEKYAVPPDADMQPGGITFIKRVESPESIQCVDFVEWIEQYNGPRFNLIHCDFPYGIGVFNATGVRTGAQRGQMGRDEGEDYDDDPETYRLLVEALCRNLDRIMSVSAHIMFWFSNKWEIECWTRDIFRRLAPSVEWTRYPLIWMKSDNAGIAAIPTREPRHTYEVCLLGSRGSRNLVGLKSDAYACPTDKALHTSAKPEPMLRHFMGMLVDQNTTLLDPTCGGGSALRAAESLGAMKVLGLERDPRMVELARAVLRASRAKREAEKLANGK